MSEETIVEQLTSLGAIVRRGKLGSVLLVDFRESKPRLTEDIDAFLLGRAWSDVLSCFDKCRELYLTGLPIDDKSVGELASQMPGLQVLDLEATAVTDRVFDSVSSLEKLKMLVLTGTSVSEESIRAARKRMIRTRIIKLS